jgi:aldehyde:ferredoxin oxidoreductase
MKIKKAFTKRVLIINLTDERFNTHKIPQDWIKDYIGGKGLALRYFQEFSSYQAEPFSEENIIAIFTGAFSGTGAPNSGRFSALTKSPLTNILVHSSCGGNFGIALKETGFDGIIIKGRLKNWKIIKIDENSVEFLDATHLLGKGTKESQNILNLNSKEGLLTIGPAGENKVLYANVRSDDRFFGRGGIGAVFGDKKIKAIIAKGGKYKIKPHDEKKFNRYKKTANKMLISNSFTGYYYRNFGTNSNILLNNRGKILPVRNFTRGSHKKAELISGEKIKKNHTTGFSTCKPCTILCGHKGNFNNKELHVPEYETTALFGSNLEIFDPVFIAEVNELCNNLGLDTISTAVTIGYIMEAGEKGLIKTILKFGNKEGIKQFIEDIAYKKGLGLDASQGTKRLSQKYGGISFSMNVKGLEIPAYDPRGSIGQGLSYAVANRGGCHISASIFPLEVYFKLMNPYKTKGKPEFVIYFENLYTVINSLHTCLFTAFGYIFEAFLTKITPKIILSFLMKNLPKLTLNLIDISIYTKLYSAITGIPISSRQLLKAGERIIVLERYVNTKMGINAKDDTLPERFLKEAREDDSQKRVVPLSEMVKRYYEYRGYNSDGIPKEELLKKLKIKTDENTKI